MSNVNIQFHRTRLNPALFSSRLVSYHVTLFKKSICINFETCRAVFIQELARIRLIFLFLTGIVG